MTPTPENTPCADGNCAAGFSSPRGHEFVAFKFCPMCGHPIDEEMLEKGKKAADALAMGTPTGGDERVEELSQAVREEGGATKENLVLSCFSYACRALDHYQEVQSKQVNLPLLEYQLQVLIMLATDCAVMMGKQVALMAYRGGNMQMHDWASITEDEANSIAFGQLRSMLAGAKVVAKLAADHPTPPDETPSR